jgi:hypothetical protein
MPGTKKINKEKRNQKSKEKKQGEVEHEGKNGLMKWMRRDGVG